MYMSKYDNKTNKMQVLALVQNPFHAITIAQFCINYCIFRQTKD